MKFLLIKTSSMGDLVHTLPAINDIAHHFPNAQLDWLAEDEFADIAKLHNAIGQIHLCSMRKWRHRLLVADTWRQIIALRSTIRSQEYDYIIDFQGLIKSAIWTWKAAKNTHGYDWASARESIASLFYQHRHSLEANLHAIERNRLLAGKALGYIPNDAINWGILVRVSQQVDKKQKQVTFLHATSKKEKMLPSLHWTHLISKFNQAGYQVILPWYSDAERQQALQIASNGNVKLIQSSSIAGLIPVLAQSYLVVSVDTGLAHLANALGVPTCVLFIASSPNRTGVVGENSINIASSGINEIRSNGQLQPRTVRLNMSDIELIYSHANTLMINADD